MTAQIDIGKLVDLRIRLKDRIEISEKEAKEVVSEDKEKLKKIDALILNFLLESNQESARTDSGTAFKNIKESFTVKDKEVFLNWVKENEMWHMLPSSVNSADAREFMLESGGMLPPGVAYSSYAAIGVRRPTGKQARN